MGKKSKKGSKKGGSKAAKGMHIEENEMYDEIDLFAQSKIKVPVRPGAQLEVSVLSFCRVFLIACTSMRAGPDPRRVPISQIRYSYMFPHYSQYITMSVNFDSITVLPLL